jgi:hypothetical protein
MNDIEARYLIDQYNKYVSWAVRAREVFFAVYFGFSMAGLALLYSIAFQVMPTEDKYALTLLAVVTLFAFMWAFRIYDKRVISTYRSHRSCLCMLEDYRFKHRLLPDQVTFRKIVESKPEELETLLKENEPSSTDSRKTLPI